MPYVLLRGGKKFSHLQLVKSNGALNCRFYTTDILAFISLYKNNPLVSDASIGSYQGVALITDVYVVNYRYLQTSK